MERYYQLIKSEKVVLSYKGGIDADAIHHLVRLVEKNLADADEKLSIRKKIVNLTVEALQNILNYFSEEALDKFLENESFMILTSNKQNYEILTGNYISIQRMKTLKKRIDNVNMMSQEDLQKVYLDILENPKVSITRGAGLGLIDMARRSQNKITYQFNDYNEDYTLFLMTTTINKVKNEVAVA
ncbi:MAG: SiaB family protein kinase [Thermonemataceae bacterium]|nr:SiaB family protein kinase [Thermonemataceae bacterium]